jgi:hypothetical protein
VPSYQRGEATTRGLDPGSLQAKVDIEVISGLEEARLIHLGVLQAVPVLDQRMILVDIGGGSTEVLVGERGETLAARSFKLGSVRLTDRFFPDGTISPDQKSKTPQGWSLAWRSENLISGFRVGVEMPHLEPRAIVASSMHHDDTERTPSTGSSSRSLNFNRSLSRWPRRRRPTTAGRGGLDPALRRHRRRHW